jgi:hypothetical protein
VPRNRMGAHDQQLTTTEGQIAVVFDSTHLVYNTVVLEACGKTPVPAITKRACGIP